MSQLAFSKQSAQFYGTLPKKRSPKKKVSSLIKSGKPKGIGDYIQDKKMSVINYKLDAVATELTLINTALFRKLQDNDISSLKWYHARTKPEVESDRVRKIANRFNYEVNWAIRQILQEATSKKRAEVFAYLAKLVKRLFELNNFHSSFAIWSALDSNPIRRLEKTRKLVAKKDFAYLNDGNHYYSNENNWSAFRELQDNAGLPQVPHIGFYKADLVYVYHNFTNDAIRIAKMREIEKSIFKLFEKSNYSFLESNAELHNYLLDIEYLVELQRFVDDENMKLSKTLEPDEEKSDEEESAAVPSSTWYNQGSPNSEPQILDDNSAETNNLPAVLPPTSEKKRKHKRHNSSMSSNEISINLIDDSTIEPTPPESGDSFASLPTRGSSLRLPHHAASYQAPADSRTSSMVSSLSSNGEGGTFELQGILRFKHVVKDGQLRRFAQWRKYWVGVNYSEIMLYGAKAFSACASRKHFGKAPAKVKNLSGWHVEPVTGEFKSLTSECDAKKGLGHSPSCSAIKDSLHSPTNSSLSHQFPGSDFGSDSLSARSSQSNYGLDADDFDEQVLNEEVSLSTSTIPSSSSGAVGQDVQNLSIPEATDANQLQGKFCSPRPTHATSSSDLSSICAQSIRSSFPSAASSSRLIRNKSISSRRRFNNDKDFKSVKPEAFKLSSADRRDTYLVKAATLCEMKEWISTLVCATHKTGGPNLIHLD